MATDRPRAVLPPGLAGALLALAAVLPAPPAGAATVLDKSVRATIGADGRLSEETTLSVRIERAEDLARWSPFAIPLDENCTLDEVTAWATTPDGRRVKPGRKDHDTAEVAAPGELHSSAKLHLVSFPELPAGSVLSIAYRVTVAPYFPAAQLLLAERDRVERLRVEVRGGGAGWRYQIDGARDGLSVEETAGGVTVTATGLAAPDPPDLAPEAAETGPVLRWAWGEGSGWDGVGKWYTGLLRPLPRDSGAVGGEAAGLLAGVEGRRARLEALLGFVRRQVRYVAVEVGAGGYRPSPPAEVLARRWGDCKDKSLLLVDLLAASGIEAYPALVRASSSGAVDADFPSPLQFNHMIVAVPAAAVETAPGDPVAGGYLFVDPTQERGGAHWLHPWVQGQESLVVRADGAALVRTPLAPEGEASRLVVNAVLGRDGTARGGAGLDLTGGLASDLASAFAAGSPGEDEETVRRVLGRLLPGATIGRVSWSVEPGDLPHVSLSAAVELPALATPGASGLSLELRSLIATPEPSLLAGRTQPVVLSPGSTGVSWRLRLPAAGCRPERQDADLDVGLGVLHQSVGGDATSLAVERTLLLRRRRIGPDDLPKLAELAVAERRAARRRIRLLCPPPE